MKYSKKFKSFKEQIELMGTIVKQLEVNDKKLYELSLEQAAEIIPKLTKDSILNLSIIYFYYYAHFINFDKKY